MKRQDVTVSSDGGLGHVRLNRPKSFNALTVDMCRTITAALQSWEFDPAIAAIMIDHGEGRGFCAGGVAQHPERRREADLPDRAQF